jgi:phospholipid/cholesterol/gamma-HCH transport system substrate-binding protein
MRIFGRSGGAAEEPLRRPLPVARLIAFLVVGLLALAYLLFNVIGAKTFEGSYSVLVRMPVTGGLFPGSQVTYRGVPVGSVSSIRIEPDLDDVAVTLNIHDGVHVPASTLAVVADRSPAGEQYLDFQPPSGSGAPYLRNGSVIQAAATRRPPSLGGLLNSVTAFSDSVNLNHLRTVFDQLETAFGGTGPALGRLIDNSAKLVASLEGVEPATIDLLTSGGRVLDTQAAHAGDLRTLSGSLRRLADTLRADDPNTVSLIDNALTTTRTIGPFLRQDAGTIGMLLVNLVTTGRIAVQRLPGLKALLISLPGGLRALASAVSGNHVNFTLLLQTGNACKYPHTRREAPYDPHRYPPITNGYCLNPDQKQQQRGAVYAPRPPGDDTAYPPSGHMSSHAAAAGTRNATTSPADSTPGQDSWMQIYTAGAG